MFTPDGQFVKKENTYQALEKDVAKIVKAPNPEDMNLEDLYDYTLMVGCDCVVIHAEGLGVRRPKISLKKGNLKRLCPVDLHCTNDEHVVAVFVFAGPVATTVKPAPRGTTRARTRRMRARRSRGSALLRGLAGVVTCSKILDHRWGSCTSAWNDVTFSDDGQRL